MSLTVPKVQSIKLDVLLAVRKYASFLYNNKGRDEQPVGLGACPYQLQYHEEF